MRVKVAMIAGLAIALSSMVGITQTTPVSAKKEEVTICHRTTSYKNPYVTLTVDADSVDGDAGNDHGQGDHYLEHLGPVFYPEIPKHTEWGDIIPPVEGVHQGRNWTTEGQAIYNNDCNPVVTYPVLDFSVVCDVKNQDFVISFTNEGTADGEAIVNDEVIALVPNVPVTKTIHTGETGVQVTIVIDEETVYSQFVKCVPGRGGGGTTPETPATPAETPAEAMPFTSGEGAQAAVITGSLVAAFAGLASVVRRVITTRI